MSLTGGDGGGGGGSGNLVASVPPPISHFLIATELVGGEGEGRTGRMSLTPTSSQGLTAHLAAASIHTTVSMTDYKFGCQ